MERELGMVKQYGLRNRRELWKVESTLRNYRRVARKLLGTPGLVDDEQAHEHRVARDILANLRRLGVLSAESGLDNVLTMKVEDLLERRLQTQVLRRGLAHTLKEARQRIVHGHITVAGKKVTVPSYLVSVEDESRMAFYDNSPLRSRVEARPQPPVPQPVVQTPSEEVS